MQHLSVVKGRNAPPQQPSLGRYLVEWELRGQPGIREARVVEISPSKEWARVIWEAVPLDQEWVEAKRLFPAVLETLEIRHSLPGAPSQMVPYPSPTELRRV